MKYTPQLKATAREMYLNNISLSEISQQLKIEPSTLSSWNRKDGWEAQRKEIERSDAMVVKAIERFEAQPTTLPNLTVEEKAASTDLVKEKLAIIAENKVKQIEAVNNLHKGAMNAIGVLIKQTLEALNTPIYDADPDKARQKKRVERESAAKILQKLGLDLGEISRANGMQGPQVAIQNNLYGNSGNNDNDEPLDQPKGVNPINIIINTLPLPDNHADKAKAIEADAVIEANNNLKKEQGNV